MTTHKNLLHLRWSGEEVYKQLALEQQGTTNCKQETCSSTLPQILKVENGDLTNVAQCLEVHNISSSSTATLLNPSIKQGCIEMPKNNLEASNVQSNKDAKENLKVEKRKENNRMAARRCRKRKEDRIHNLEHRLCQLKDENEEGTEKVSELHDAISNLKQELLEHVKNGCQVYMPGSHVVT